MTSAPDWRRAGRAVAVLFFVNGATFSNWIPRIPEVRDRLGVSNAGLGASLLGGGLGGLLASLVVARLLGRFGTRASVVAAAGLLACCLPLIAVVPGPFSLLVVLSGLGMLDVINDLAMNAQGVMVQQHLGRSIMQRLHACWSLGFLSGAAVGSLASAAQVGIGLHLTVVGVVLALTVGAVRPRLIASDQPAPTTPARRTGRYGKGISVTVVATAVMATAVGVIEAIPNDWSAVLSGDLFDAGPLTGVAALLYAGCMLAGRLAGDRALDRFGPRRVLDGAFGAVVGGVAMVALAPVLWVSLVGFALWGLGVSVLFPQLYTMAATLPATAAGVGLGAMALGQRLGFLLEPVGMGVLSEATDLRRAVAVFGLSGVVLALAARRVVGSHHSLDAAPHRGGGRAVQGARNIR